MRIDVAQNGKVMLFGGRLRISGGERELEGRDFGLMTESSTSSQHLGNDSHRPQGQQLSKRNSRGTFCSRPE